MANLTFLTGGDVAPIRKVPQGMFGEIGPLFRRADVSFFNLELPLSRKGEPPRGKATYHRGTPEDMEGIAETAVSCVNLANNHILDFGDEAMFETIGLLDEKKIGRFGAGRNLDEARKGCIVEKNGIRIGFLGYTTTLPVGFAATADRPGVNALQAYTAYQPKVNLFEYPGTLPQVVTWTDPDHLRRMRDDIAAFGQQIDVLIVYVHWGTSMSPQVHDLQREIAKAAIDAGAHALFGGHQHVVSGIEFYKDCPIVHGAGNLLFDTWASFFTDETRKTFLFGATIGRGGLRDCYMLPVKTGVDVPPQLLTRGDAMWKTICEDVQRHSSAFGTQFIAPQDANRLEVRPG